MIDKISEKAIKLNITSEHIEILKECYNGIKIKVLKHHKNMNQLQKFVKKCNEKTP